MARSNKDGESGGVALSVNGGGRVILRAKGTGPVALKARMGERPEPPGPSLPYDAEVEWLESTGTQYIDTGVVPTDTTVVALWADYTYSNAINYLLGVISTDYRTNCFAFSCNPETNGFYRVFVSGSTIRSQQGNTGKSVCAYPSISFCRVGANLLEIDTDTYEFAYPSGLPLKISHTLYLFTRNSAGVAFSPCTIMKFRGCRVTTGGNIVRDYIPVRVGSGANAIGYLYDRANPNGGPLGNGLYGSANPNSPFIGSCIGPDKP